MPDSDTIRSSSSQPGLRDSIDLGGQAGLATYVAAKIFGSPSLPPGTPDWLRDSIDSQANFAQSLPGADAMTLGSAGGGPLDPKTQRERQRDAEAESIEYLTVRLEQAERERQHEAQWLSQTHTYAGQTLTGAQWREMKTWFGNAENTQGWEDAMVTETGESRAEVRRTGGKMKRFYDLMDKDSKGTLSKEEQTEFTTLQSDTKVKRGIEVQQELQKLRVEHGHDQTVDSDMRDSGSQRVSVAGRSDLYADDALPAQGLAAVRPLLPAYRKATDAVAALEQPAPVKAAVPVAANTITVNPANMFG